MKINIYYGGRGVIEDPTLYVISEVQTVLEELRVEVKRYNLFEEKNTISTLPITLKEADGIVLAASLEWYGMGGLMQQFLDACWLYGDKEKIASIYMMPIVIGTTYGEREVQLNLTKCWELLGGIPYAGICAYVDNNLEFETNQDYVTAIEKSAENFYRAINTKIKCLPNSTTAVRKSVSKTRTVEMTPQESEQLSRFVSDDAYVRKQKEDIEELTAMFKQMLGEKNEKPREDLIVQFKSHFNQECGCQASYLIVIIDQNQSLYLKIQGKCLLCEYSSEPPQTVDVTIKVNSQILKTIMNGQITFQRAFMTGDVVSKGDFQSLRALDQIFKF